VLKGRAPPNAFSGALPMPGSLGHLYITYIMNILTARGWAPQNLSTYLSPKIYGYELVQVLENKGLEEA